MVNRKFPFNSRVPMYDDDSDYLTNANSYYDDLARKNKLIQKLSEKIWEYEEIIKKQFAEWDEELKRRFLEWDKNLEEFDDEVLRLLQQWMDDGTIDQIIQERVENVLNDKASIVYVDGQIELLERKIKERIEVNILDYEGKGDGVTDNRNPLLNALSDLEENGGGILRFPRGHYMLSGEFTIPDNVELKGEGRSTVIEHMERGVLFRVDGSYSDRVVVTQDSILGDNFVYVSDTSPFRVGDYIRIMSQRPATDNTQDMNYQLGHATSPNHKLYFGEIRRISSINDNQLFFRGGLMYPSYKASATDEIHPQARRNSTVDKVNYVDGVSFSDLTFKGNVGTPMRLSIGKFLNVSNVHWYDAEDGDLVSFRECFMSEAYQCKLVYNPSIPESSIYSRNGLKTVSSWACGFDQCEVHNGTQSVDFTYNTDGEAIPNIASYFKNGKIVGAIFNSVTAHGGTDLTQITNNIMLSCHRSGIGSRSRNAIITGNTIVGGANLVEAESTFGITVEQSGAVNNIISGNIIKQFLIGVRLHDQLDSRIDHPMRLMIKDNNISLVNKGVQLRRNTGSIYRGSSFIFIEGNVFSNFIGEYGKCVDIYDRINNVTFKNNLIDGNESINGGFYSRGNSHNFTIIGNKFLNTGRHIWLEPVDTEIESQPTVWLFDNTFSPVFNGNSELSNFRRLIPYAYANFSPIDDSTFNLGWSDRKWDRIFLAQNPVVASDRKLKENIKPIQSGLEFVNALNPVSYNLKNKDNKEYGLIAQEVKKVLDDNKEVVSIVEYFEDGDLYTLKYEQLIPVLIKAIQELNEKLGD